MERIIDKKLVEWKNSTNRKPLIFSGARQVGKSYTIREFGNNHFEKVIEINFEKRKDLHSVFEYNLDVKRIIKEMEILLGVNIHSGKNLLFFDEIQSCLNAFKSLRYFYEDSHHIPLISAGSLLDFEFRNISFPVGRVEMMYMYPMNFQEFLLALGQEQLWQYISDEKEIPNYIENKIYDYLDDYFFIGGMPEVVQSYVLDKDYFKVQKIQEDLLYAYENDFGKYQPVVNKDCLLEILGGLSKHIGNQGIYTKLSNNFSGVTVKKGVTVLSIARLIHKVQNVGISGLPLLPSGKQFKLIFSDIGLLSKLSGLTPSDRIQKDKWSAQFRGFMAEQYIGQELIFKQNKLYYWARTEPGAASEVDYIITKSGEIIPIEVKSGDKGSLKSLHYLLDNNKQIKESIVFSKSKRGQIDKINFVPMYQVGLL